MTPCISEKYSWLNRIKEVFRIVCLCVSRKAISHRDSFLRALYVNLGSWFVLQYHPSFKVILDVSQNEWCWSWLVIEIVSLMDIVSLDGVCGVCAFWYIPCDFYSVCVGFTLIKMHTHTSVCNIWMCVLAFDWNLDTHNSHFLYHIDFCRHKNCRCLQQEMLKIIPEL